MLIEHLPQSPAFFSGICARCFRADLLHVIPVLAAHETAGTTRAVVDDTQQIWRVCMPPGGTIRDHVLYDSSMASCCISFFPQRPHVQARRRL